MKETISDVGLTINFTLRTKLNEAPELTRALDGKAGYLANGDITHPYYQTATKPVGIYTLSAAWANGDADAATWAAAGKSGDNTEWAVKVTANAQVESNIYAQLIKDDGTSSEDHAANTEGAPSTAEVRNVISERVFTVVINNSTGALSIKTSNEGKYCLRPGSEGVDAYVAEGYSGLFTVSEKTL